MPSRRPHSLSLLAFSDRELLNVVLDYASDAGWVTNEQIAAAIGLDHSRALQCVGARFSWLRRYGVMERHEKTGEWRLTSTGEKIALGSLAPDEQEAMEHLTPEKLMEATALLTRRYRRVNGTAATMMRRAWTHGTATKGGKP